MTGATAFAQAAPTTAPAPAAAAVTPAAPTTAPAAGTAAPRELASSAHKGDVNTGDNAWMLTSSAFVMLMVPGLALFYAGMVRRKNVLGTMMHSMAALGIIGVEWIVIGYAMSFGATKGGIVGWDPKLLFLNGVLPEDLHNGSNVSELVYVMFQGMFAIITPALITGAFAERVKFSAFAAFTLLWGILIYNPLAHWVWGGGWLGPAPAYAARQCVEGGTADEDGVGGDDAADALRYLVATRARTVSQRKLRGV